MAAAAGGAVQEQDADERHDDDTNSPLSPCPPPPPPAAAPPRLHHHPHRLLSLHLSAAPPAPPRPLPPASCPSPSPDRPTRDDCWSENATLSLIQAWGARHVELNRGNLKRKHWKDVADCVNSRPFGCSKPAKSDIQCKNRLDTLKKKYKIEKSRLLTGGATTKWAFFDRLNELIGSCEKAKDQSFCNLSRSAADANGLHNRDDPCMAMPIARCSPEDDTKPPLFFTPPPATLELKPPPFSHHVGEVAVYNPSHVGSARHWDHNASAPMAHHLVADGAPISHLAAMGAYHLLNNLGGAALLSHRGDGVGSDAATDTSSKSKVGPRISQSSLPHKTPVCERTLKRRKDRFRQSEDGPYRELAQAICKLADVYERVEIAKLEQAAALEKRRREFIKDLEIQRMQTFAKLQIDRAKVKYGSKGHSNAEDRT